MSCHAIICIDVVYFSDVLLSAAYQWRKNVVVVVDVGNSLSDTQLHIMKAVAKHIIYSLGDNDWVCNLKYDINIKAKH